MCQFNFSDYNPRGTVVYELNSCHHFCQEDGGIDSCSKTFRHDIRSSLQPLNCGHKPLHPPTSVLSYQGNSCLCIIKIITILITISLIVALGVAGILVLGFIIGLLVVFRRTGRRNLVILLFVLSVTCCFTCAIVRPSVRLSAFYMVACFTYENFFQPRKPPFRMC